MVLRCIPVDLLFICAELVTGKSIPVLVGITRLPIDQFLAWFMLFLGALGGTFFSVYSSRAVAGMTLPGFINRLVQLSFSLYLSLSLIFSIAKAIHPGRGVVLSIIPAFCVAAQNMPQRDSTALLAFALCCVAFYVGMITAVTPSGLAVYPLAVPSLAPKPASHHIKRSLEQESVALWQYVGRALQLFLLSFYACLQHAPTQVYFAIQHHHCKPASYASHHHANHGHYTLFVGLVSAWVRICVWTSVCFFQDNTFHSIIENDLSRGKWDWFCCSLYMTTLLYSACWTATQIREQVLPRFRIDSAQARLKYLVIILALAVLFRQRDAQTMFIATNVLVAISLLTTLCTLKKLRHTVGHHKG
jgi:hypothetical protein